MLQQLNGSPVYILGEGSSGGIVDTMLPVTEDLTGFDPILNGDVVGNYSSTTRKVTLTNVCPLYARGVQVPLPEGWESPAHADVTGTYYLRYNAESRQFLFDTTPWGWYDAMIAYVQYDAATKIGRGIREFHGCEMPWTVHRHFHENIGTFRRSGGGLSGVVLNSTTPANRRPLVSAMVVQDEDLSSPVNRLDSASYTQRYLAGAGATRSFVFGASDIIKTSGAVPLWNQYTGGAWSDTQFVNGEYGAVFLVAVPVMEDADSQAIRYMWVQPQTVSPSLSVIQAITPNNIIHGDSAQLVSEFVFTAKVIIRYHGGGWTVISTENLTGSRFVQVGSPSGSYLTAVSTDSSLSGNGTVSNPLSAKPLTGQTAPTTATVGFQGQVIYDTNNNKWTMIAKVGSNYMWSPDGFPADNTEYPAYIEGGLVVWKKLYSGTSGAGTSPSGQSLGISPIASVKHMHGYMKYDGSNDILLPLANNYSSGVNSCGYDLRALTTNPAVWTWGSGTFTQSKPFYLYIYYTKA